MPQVDPYWISVPKGILRHLVLFLFHYLTKMIGDFLVVRKS